MLEPEMDIESDLGIDSIKRVEILGTAQEKIPSLPEIPGEQLAELRTLGQIIEYLNQMLGESTPPKQIDSAMVTPAQSGSGTAAQDPEKNFLSIISEKTGYPPEMLELNMDMEADLGIDSIKRVEIMWSLQEQLPHLPQVSGSEVGELRTLKEIADHLSSLVPSDLHDSPIIPAPISDSSVPVKKKS